ncbi:NUDIX hydrolase [Pseudothermotoga thermarum]|uniref:NUDIX hydrolase n=1 Tax=Pseudothermotoga thermarum DSM 5069 TaxID=688269 RepID=F7YWM5_9THEM|nr:NUDIX hydrolase [Pseudothermotoga thermarum]AEH52010.1 NUDIX hydrolase [Pseudothermotoga thermarum DSM 5069]
MFEKTIESQEIFKGKILTVKLDKVELANKVQSTREVVLHPGAVAILPILDEEKLILVKQYRYAVDQQLLEVPAGKLDLGEKPEECAKRELEEETGYRCGKLEYLGFIYTTPGFSNEKIHLFVAKDLEKTLQKLDEDEILHVVQMNLSDAILKCLNGEIVDAKTICLLLMYYVKRRDENG